MALYKYIGCTDCQVSWGSCSDPRGILKVGNLYQSYRKEVHSWHTKLFLRDFPDLGFNSVCFEEVTDAGK